MVEDELAHWLEDDGLGTRPTTICYGPMPDSPDALICLRKYGGMQNETNYDGTVRLEFPRVMVQVRGVREDYDNPNLMIQKVVKSVTKIGNQTLYGVFYDAVLVVTPPYHFGRDDNFRHQFNCNLQVMKAFTDPG